AHYLLATTAHLDLARRGGPARPRAPLRLARRGRGRAAPVAPARRPRLGRLAARIPGGARFALGRGSPHAPGARLRGARPGYAAGVHTLPRPAAPPSAEAGTDGRERAHSS